MIPYVPFSLEVNGVLDLKHLHIGPGPNQGMALAAAMSITVQNGICLPDSRRRAKRRAHDNPGDTGCVGVDCTGAGSASHKGKSVRRKVVVHVLLLLRRGKRDVVGETEPPEMFDNR